MCVRNAVVLAGLVSAAEYRVSSISSGVDRLQLVYEQPEQVVMRVGVGRHFEFQSLCLSIRTHPHETFLDFAIEC